MKRKSPETPLRTEPLKKSHDRHGFSCGIPPLDLYFQQQASQDSKRKIATVFVALDEDTKTILGYYTLSMAAIPLLDLPDTLTRKLPKYASVPALRLGRLAVQRTHQRKGLGSRLLMDAFNRALVNEIAWTVFLVDAKDEAARRFYMAFGFQSFMDDPNHLYLPRRTLEQAFGVSPSSASD